MNYLVGWKEIARYVGCHVRTIKRWHDKVKPIPIIKVGAHNASVRVEIHILQSWIESVRASR